jgi:hypothetical protein
MFENLLQLAADEDKATLTTMAGKYPTLKKFFELGEKVEPVRERLAALHPSYADDLAAPVKELEDWRKFRQTDWPAWQSEHTRIEQALAEASAQVAELENNRSAEVTPDEIKEIVNATLAAAGLVKNADLEAQMVKVINEKVGPTLDAKINGLTLRFEDVFDKIEEVRDRHHSTFSENIRPKQVFEYMKENKITDPEEAWTKMTAGKLAEKTAAQITAEKKAEYDKGKAEGAKEALKAAGAQRSPVDGQGGSAPKPGALMRRAQARMPKDKAGEIDSSKIPLGKGVARVATQEYYNKKAEAVQ